MNHSRSAREVFDDWALDYHAEGMEEDHRPSVEEAFELIQPSSGKYLEIGVGNGYGLEQMAQNQYREGRCIGVDVSPNMVRNATERTRHLSNVHVYTADFMQLAPDADPPDFIFSMEVFYYLPDIQKGLDHAYNLLAGEGILMVLVNHYRERLDSHEWADQLDTPMQLWSAADYVEGFSRAGFVDIQQRHFGASPEPAVLQINPGTLGTWGRKP
jgi:ubiquinone/menaquinone biosynthesis C-methylase UbiE